MNGFGHKGCSNRVCKHPVRPLRKLRFDFLDIRTGHSDSSRTPKQWPGQLLHRRTATVGSTSYVAASSQNSVLPHNSRHGYKSSSFHCLSVTAHGWQDP